nr:Gag-Pol polyprotein [Tanacetum cinerariifolium]
MTKQERESMLYDAFDKFTYEPEESIHSYYLRFAKLINDMNMILVSMTPMQINEKFVNHLQPNGSSQVSVQNVQGKQSQGYVGNARNNQALGVLVINTDHIDAHDSDCDDEATTNTFFMEIFSLIGSLNDDTVKPHYDSDILSKYPNNDSYDELKGNYDVISYTDYMLTIRNDKDNYVPHPIQKNDMTLSVIEQMKSQAEKCNKVHQESKSVNESLTSELERFKDRVGVLEYAVKDGHSKQEAYLSHELYTTINDRNRKVYEYEKQVLSQQTQMKDLNNHIDFVKKNFEILKQESFEKYEKNISEIVDLEKVLRNLNNARELLTKFDECIKRRTKLSPHEIGSWEQSDIKGAFKADVIPFSKNLKETFKLFENGFIREVKEMKDIFKQIEDEVDQCFVAEVVATACHTQKLLPNPYRYNKTPYELLIDCKAELNYLYVFGALCYPTNDFEDLRKLQPKADIRIFIGYSTSKKAYQIYNKRTRQIMETINDLLFQPMFDEYFKNLSVASTPISSRILPSPDIVEVSSSSSSSTSIDKDALLPNTSLVASSLRIVDTFQQPPIYTKRWIEDHSFAKIIEPKNYKEAMEESCWIEAMQEEIYEFKWLEVCELGPRPDRAIIISLNLSDGFEDGISKWHFKGKGVRCQDTRRSTSGSAQLLGENLVNWSSKKQKCTAISTTEAKYISLIQHVKKNSQAKIVSEEQLDPCSNRLVIKKNNQRVASDSHITDIMLSQAIQTGFLNYNYTDHLPHQLWTTINLNKNNHTFNFELDTNTSTLTPRLLKTVLQMPPPDTNNTYIQPPSKIQILEFIKTLGYDEDPETKLMAVSKMVATRLHQQ